MKALKTLLILCTLASPAAADLLSGQVVNSSGVGIGMVNIDVEDMITGDKPAFSNAGTNAAGFFNMTVPAGLWQLTFTPPPPPASSALVTVVDNVFVAGASNMGTVVLDPGAVLSGRVLTPQATPVSNVNIDVLQAGTELDTNKDNTNLFGQFTIVVPFGDIELRLDSFPAIPAGLASLAMDLTMTGNLNLGDITLPAGMVLSGSVFAPGPAPVNNASIDIVDSATGKLIYTTHDKTDGFGAFSFVVPAGTWDVEICPPAGAPLVAYDVENLVVSSNLSLGIVFLLGGVVLSGNIQTFDGFPAAGADVDVRNAVTGEAYFACKDNADAAGNYSVLVPTGSLDVTFTPKGFSQPLGTDLHTGVVVAGNTILNGVLPECQFSTQYGTGSPGTGGFVPVLSSSGGAPRVGNPNWSWEIDNAVGGTVALIYLGFGPLSLPLSGGTLLINPLPTTFSFVTQVAGPAGVGGAGTASLTFPFPIASSFAGLTIYDQAFVLDAGTPFLIAMTNGLSVTFCD